MQCALKNLQVHTYYKFQKSTVKPLLSGHPRGKLMVSGCLIGVLFYLQCYTDIWTLIAGRLIGDGRLIGGCSPRLQVHVNMSYLLVIMHIL